MFVSFYNVRRYQNTAMDLVLLTWFTMGVNQGSGQTLATNSRDRVVSHKKVIQVCKQWGQERRTESYKRRMRESGVQRESLWHWMRSVRCLARLVRLTGGRASRALSGMSVQRRLSARQCILSNEPSSAPILCSRLGTVHPSAVQ